MGLRLVNILCRGSFTSLHEGGESLEEWERGGEGGNVGGLGLKRDKVLIM